MLVLVSGLNLKKKFDPDRSHVWGVDVEVDMVNIFAEISVSILAQGSLA